MGGPWWPVRQLGGVVEREWLALGSRLGDWVNRVSGRGDLVVSVAPVEGGSSRFFPESALIEVDAEALLGPEGRPGAVNPRDPRDRARHGVLFGVVAHEAAHAAHTRLGDPGGVDPVVWGWAGLLEESRCEAAALALRPGDRGLLRAAVGHQVAGGRLGDVGEGGVRGLAGRAAVLLLARADAGVLEADEVVGLEECVVGVLGAECVAVLRGAWSTARALADGDVEGLLACAALVAGALAEDGVEEEPEEDEEPGEDEDGGVEGGGAEPGGEGAGDGRGVGAGGAGLEEDGSDVDGAAGEGEPGAGGGAGGVLPCGAVVGAPGVPGVPGATGGGDLVDEPEGDDGGVVDAVEGALERAAAGGEAELARAVVVFPRRGDGERERERELAREEQAAAEGAIGKGGRGEDAVKIVAREATATERGNARVLREQIRRAQYRQVEVVRLASMTPPGRLSVMQVARREGQVAQGVRVSATPWTQTRRRTVDQPPLTVGIALDVSGSLEKWAPVVSGFAWALASAVKGLAGRVGAVAWNTGATEMLRPGRTPLLVPQAKVDGASTGCPVALKALSGALGLRGALGARVVVVLTDADLPNGDEVDAAVEVLVGSGVLVLWVQVPAPVYALHGKQWFVEGEEWVEWVPPGAVGVRLEDPGDFALVVGRALGKALSEA